MCWKIRQTFLYEFRNYNGETPEEKRGTGMIELKLNGIGETGVLSFKSHFLKEGNCGTSMQKGLIPPPHVTGVGWLFEERVRGFCGPD
ncbi:hypothetical protein CEXT_168681 [Caerostris extrusa]|uniref:Uncharacterized protein n=1 Tax=Caerostris extrusa TaxID=172846 RepID=A0AAV4MCT8_CAEEX|nr:hypothetical protein CEXT_168681 [Caerostris extrusa]